MGSIRRSPRSGKWEVRYRDPLGGQHTKTFKAKADARVHLASVEADIARGNWADPRLRKTTFAELAAAWMGGNPRKRPTTYARDAYVIRVHLSPFLGPMLVAQLRPNEVQQVIERMIVRGLAPKTVRAHYGVLRAILTWGVNNDILDRSPCRAIRLPELRRTERPLVSADDVVRLADAMPAEYRVAIFLGALGLRQAEVFGLRVGAIDFLRRTLTVRATINEVEGRFVEGGGKTASSARTISVPQSNIDELAGHLALTGRNKPDDLVLQAPGGGPVRATNFRLRVYGPALTPTGLEGLTFHRLRHSAGYMLRELGVPLEVIQRRLGHASIRTTADIYGSLPEQVDRSVADQLDLLYRESGNRECVVEAEPG